MIQIGKLISLCDVWRFEILQFFIRSLYRFFFLSIFRQFTSSFFLLLSYSYFLYCRKISCYTHTHLHSRCCESCDKTSSFFCLSAEFVILIAFCQTEILVLCNQKAWNPKANFLKLQIFCGFFVYFRTISIVGFTIRHYGIAWQPSHRKRKGLPLKIANI